MVNLFQFDQQFKRPVCGIDEVGRGPLAGPVVAACVYIPPDVLDNPLWAEITDSKKISAVKRERLFEPLKALCVYGLSEVNAQEIDRLNIHHATLLAMKRAYHEMLSALAPASFRRRSESTLVAGMDPGLRRDDVSSLWDNMIALIDGKFAPELPCRTQTVIKGDSLSLSIGAASILAKVTRDRMMAKLHQEFPDYGWDTNAGYGTKVHIEGLETHGLTPFHRLSYAPCAAVKKKTY